jgi:Ca2+-binding RTX toxin-like protein
MKKAIFILLAMLAAQTASVAHAETTYTVVLAGGSTQNSIRIWPTPDGRSYVIDSAVPLEVGGSVCENTPGVPTELTCKAALVAGFEINGGESDDAFSVSSAIDLPVTMRGGSGNDTLVGGGGPDKLIGGEGNDRVAGRGGSDVLYGGPGSDELLGGPGNDVLRGGGTDVMDGGSGHNTLIRNNVVKPSS